MVENVSITIDIFNVVAYKDDEKLEQLETLLKELKQDYLIQHLRRFRSAGLIEITISWFIIS